MHENPLDDFALGCAVLSVNQIDGEYYTMDTIAKATGTTKQNIYLIQQRAIRRLCNKLMFQPRYKDLIEFFQTR